MRDVLDIPRDSCLHNGDGSSTAHTTSCFSQASQWPRQQPRQHPSQYQLDQVVLWARWGRLRPATRPDSPAESPKQAKTPRHKPRRSFSWPVQDPRGEYKDCDLPVCLVPEIGPGHLRRRWVWLSGFSGLLQSRMAPNECRMARKDGNRPD